MKDNVNLWSYDIEKKTAWRWYGTNELNLNAVTSPDGQKVCFTKPKNNHFELWTSDVDGANAVPITQFTGQYLTAPRWSPDGKFIVFQGFLNGQSDIFKVDALGGVPQNITQSMHDEHTPFWTRQDEIYYSSNEGSVWHINKMKPDGSGVQQVIEQESYGPQVDIKGEQLYYTKKDHFGLWKYHLSDQSEELFIQDFHPMHWGAFALTSEGVHYYNPKEKQFEFYDFVAQNATVSYKPQKRIPRLGIVLSCTPDEEVLLFSQIDEHDSDIMLLEEESPPQ